MTTLAPTPTRISRVAIEDSLLGIKTSAAFLNNLGNNLRLDLASPTLSPSSSPASASLQGRQHASHSLRLAGPALHRPKPPPTQPHPERPLHRRRDSPPKRDLQGPTPAAKEPQSACLTHDAALITSARQLLCDSVAAQSRLSLHCLLTHPLNLLFLLILLLSTERCISAAWARQISSAELFHLWTSIIFVWATLLTLGLVLFVVAIHIPYQSSARSITDDWLSTDDVIVVRDQTSMGEDSKVLGMLLLEYHVRESQISKAKKRKTGRGLIRGWAVAPASQKHGFGITLLREAARVVAARGGDGLWFAEQHAHSNRKLPAFYSGAFDQRDRAAQRRLASVADEVFATSPTSRRRAYSGRGV